MAIGLMLAFNSAGLAQTVDQTVEKRESDGALAWFKRGVEFSRSGDYLSARTRFQRARSLAPHWALPHLEIAVCHLMTDNDRKIIGQALREAVRLGKEIPRAHYLYGVYLQEAGQRQEAIQHLVKSLQLRPSLADARFRLAILYVEEGRQEQGVHQLQLVVKQKPSHLGAHRNLAVLFEQSGQLEDAEQHLQLISRLHPLNAYHLTNLAKFYKRVGWPDKAKLAFRRSERIDPTKDQRRLRPLRKSADKYRPEGGWN